MTDRPPYFGDYPRGWLDYEVDNPNEWAHWVATMDQVYAETCTQLDELIDNLIRDIKDRPESKRAAADSVCFSALTKAMMAQLDKAGGPTWELIGIYNAALYRLARQRMKERGDDA